MENSERHALIPRGVKIKITICRPVHPHPDWASRPAGVVHACLNCQTESVLTPSMPSSAIITLFTVVGRCSRHAKRTLRVCHSVDVSVHLHRIQGLQSHEQTLAQGHEQFYWLDKYMYGMCTNMPRHSHLVASGNSRATRPATALVGWASPSTFANSCRTQRPLLSQGGQKSVKTSPHT